MSNRRELYHLQPSDTAPDRPLASLIRALKTDEQEPLTCAECRDHLAGLYHRTQAGATLSTPYREVVAHLANCPDCAADYHALQTALAEFEAGTLPELAAPHTFDLSFLPSPPQESPVQLAHLWQESLANRLWSLFTELQVRLQATGASFGPMPAPLVPTLAGGAVFRAEIAASQPEVLVLPAPDAAISVHLAVGPMIAGNAVVVVKLLGTASEQPLVDTLVTLRNGQRQLLMGLMTGQDGTAVFEQLPLGRYFVQVRHDQSVWEIPLVIVAGSPPS